MSIISKILSRAFNKDELQHSLSTAPNVSSHWRDVVHPECRRQLAHIAIDVEAEFCDPNKRIGNGDTHRVASGISQIAPVFRSLGIPNYWVYYGRKQTAADHDLHLIVPDPDETFVRKNRDSMFQGSNIDTVLKNDGKKTLFISGVNYSFCVFDSVMDARENDYEVVLFSDLSTDGIVNDSRTPKKCKKEMEDAGVVIIPSTEVLSHFNL